MINWTIGQLGLGEAQVLGMSPQGTGKDKEGFARVEADPSSCLRFIFFFPKKICADFEQKSVIFSIASDGSLCQHQCLTLSEAYVCMCKILQMLASQVFTSREGVSESEKCVSNDG